MRGFERSRGLFVVGGLLFVAGLPGAPSLHGGTQASTRDGAFALPGTVATQANPSAPGAALQRHVDLQGHRTSLAAMSWGRVDALSPGGAATFTPTPTATATFPPGCPLTYSIAATCAYNPTTGLYDFTFDAQITNHSSSTIDATYIQYLEASADGINYSFIRRGSATNITLAPGTTSLQGDFPNQDVPAGVFFYRIRIFLIAPDPCGQLQLYSPGAPLCGLSTPSATVTATPTSTSSLTQTPTRTLTPQSTWTPTPTPTYVYYTSTPTACPMSFTDVHPADYFYQAVLYLYCQGAVSGYSDSSFRPFNDTTRGQLSKIITLAEEWPINTQGGPHFTDVSTSNPFYAYVETAYNHGVISGYSDGTFRWGNNITRGQLSKAVVLSEGWPINTQGGPHFTDVPMIDPFYSYIETAFNHLIISGYSDGTFRPGNNATRGQICKIVYNTVTQLLPIR